MLEEPADDRLDVDVLGHAGHAGPQAADTADDEIDRNSGRARFVELLDHRRVDQRVHLRPDSSGLSRARRRDLGIDQLDQLGPHVLRRDDEPLQIARLEIAGDVVEQLRRIAAVFGSAVK